MASAKHEAMRQRRAGIGAGARTVRAEKRWQDSTYRATIRDGARRFWDSGSELAEQRRAERSARARQVLVEDPRVHQLAWHGRDSPQGKAILADFHAESRQTLVSLPVAPAAPAQVRLTDLDPTLKVALRPDVRRALRNLAMVETGCHGHDYDRLSGKARGSGARGHDKPVRIGWLIDFCKRHGVDPLHLESAVTATFRHTQDNSLAGALPHQLGEAHAFLLGLAANSSVYAGPDEVLVHVDEPVGDLVETACARVGASVYRRPGRQGRTGPSCHVRFNTALTAVLQCAGLPQGVAAGAGNTPKRSHTPGTRRLELRLPEWIRGDRLLLTTFAEGYLNGKSCQYTMTEGRPSAQLVVQGVNEAASAEFMDTLVAVLGQNGIRGSRHDFPRPFGVIRKLHILARGSLEGLFTRFTVRRHNALAMRQGLGLETNDKLWLVARTPDTPRLHARAAAGLAPPPAVPMADRHLQARHLLEQRAAKLSPPARDALRLAQLPGGMRVVLDDDVRQALHDLVLGLPGHDLFRQSLQDPKRTGRNPHDRRGPLRIDELPALAQAVGVDLAVVEASVRAVYYKLPRHGVHLRWPLVPDERQRWLKTITARHGFIRSGHQLGFIVDQADEDLVEGLIASLGTKAIDVPFRVGRGKRGFTLSQAASTVLDLVPALEATPPASPTSPEVPA